MEDIKIDEIDNGCLTSFKNHDWLDLASELKIYSNINKHRYFICMKLSFLKNSNVNISDKSKINILLKQFNQYHITYLKSIYKNFNCFDDYMIIKKFTNVLTYKQYIHFKSLKKTFNFYPFKHNTKIQIQNIHFSFLDYIYVYYQPLTLRSCCYKTFCDYPTYKITNLPKYEQKNITDHRVINNIYLDMLSKCSFDLGPKHVYLTSYQPLQYIKGNELLIPCDKLKFKRSRIISYLKSTEYSNFF
jgi:hypothetical protein